MQTQRGQRKRQGEAERDKGFGRRAAGDEALDWVLC
jgi:hypothetical protein